MHSNVKLVHFADIPTVNATAKHDAMGSAIALPV